MTTMLEPILGTVDPKIIYMFAGIMGVCIILAIIKKVFKVAIIVTIIAAIALAIVPFAEDFQEKYKYNLEDGIVTIMIEGQQYLIDRADCKSIEMQNEGMAGYSLRVVASDGALEIIIPTFMKPSVEDFASRYGIPITVRE